MKTNMHNLVRYEDWFKTSNFQVQKVEIKKMLDLFRVRKDVTLFTSFQQRLLASAAARGMLR